jgi:hypothetical protein
VGNPAVRRLVGGERCPQGGAHKLSTEFGAARSNQIADCRPGAWFSTVALQEISKATPRVGELHRVGWGPRIKLLS